MSWDLSSAKARLGIEDMQLKGGTIALLARNAAGQLQDFAIDLLPLIETLGEAIEERLNRRLDALRRGTEP